MELFLILYGIYISIVVLLVTLVFFASQHLNNNGIMDICYRPLFALAIWGAILISDTYTLLTISFALVVTLWAAWYSVRIGTQGLTAPEHEPYATWRAEWQAKGRVYFILRSFVQINVLQGVFISIVSLPIIVGIFAAESYSGFFLTIGLLISLVGLSITIRANYLREQFISQKKAGAVSAPFLTNDVFAYTRHPDYFGESLIWWGFAFAVLPLPFGFLGLVSPLFYTIVFAYITGPRIEKRMREAYGAAYETYMDQTNYFLPQFTSSSSTFDETDQK